MSPGVGQGQAPFFSQPGHLIGSPSSSRNQQVPGGLFEAPSKRQYKGKPTSVPASLGPSPLVARMISWRPPIGSPQTSDEFIECVRAAEASQALGLRQCWAPTDTEGNVMDVICPTAGISWKPTIRPWRSTRRHVQAVKLIAGYVQQSTDHPQGAVT